MPLGSQSTFFNQPPERLKVYRKVLLQVLKLRGYDHFQSHAFAKAYDYFCTSPDDYDGATASQDLYDFARLEIAAMLHDYLYIVLRANSDLPSARLADAVMVSVMKTFAKSGAEITWRRVRLWIVRRPFVAYNRYVMGKRQSSREATELLRIYALLI